MEEKAFGPILPLLIPSPPLPPNIYIYICNRGMEVIVLEAQNRIGGRVKTIDVWGMKIDVGAGYIHGKSVECFMMIGSNKL